MAYIKIEEIIKFVDSKTQIFPEDHALARECLEIVFKKETQDNTIVVDEEWVDQTLYLSSRNGAVVICFDHAGLVVGIEIT